MFADDRAESRGCLTNSPRRSRTGLPQLDAAQAAALAEKAKALGDPIRVHILYWLSHYPDLCTCELEELLGMAQSKVSYHLKQLLDAGLIQREVFGTWSHYQLSDPDLWQKLQDLTVIAMSPER